MAVPAARVSGIGEDGGSFAPRSVYNNDADEMMFFFKEISGFLCGI